MANRKSTCDLSVNEKKKLLLLYDNLPKMSQRLAAEKLGVAQSTSTLNGLLKSRAQLGVTMECGDRKFKREGKSQATDGSIVYMVSTINRLYCKMLRLTAAF